MARDRHRHRDRFRATANLPSSHRNPLHAPGCSFEATHVPQRAGDVLTSLSFLLVDPDPDKRSLWRAALAKHWPRACVTEATGEGDAMAALEKGAFDAVVGAGVSFLERVHRERPDPLRILVVASVSFELARDAINHARVDGLVREQEGAEAIVAHLGRFLDGVRPSSSLVPSTSA